MGERYIKDGIMYEKNDSFLSLGGDRRLGTVTEASLFDVGINSSHVFTPDAYGAPREEVREKGTLVLPLRTASYVVTNNDGDSTTFRHDSWQGVYAEEKNRDPGEQTESSGGSSGGGSGPSPSRGFSSASPRSGGSVRSSSLRTDRGTPPVVEKKKEDSGPSGLMLLGLGIGFSVFVCGIVGSLSQSQMVVEPPKQKKYKPEPPPEIRGETLWWGFVAFVGIFIGSFVLGHALFVSDDLWVYRLIEVIFAGLMILPSREYLLDSIESRERSLAIHAEFETRRREAWDKWQDKKFGPRSS